MPQRWQLGRVGQQCWGAVQPCANAFRNDLQQLGSRRLGRHGSVVQRCRCSLGHVWGVCRRGAQGAGKRAPGQSGGVGKLWIRMVLGWGDDAFWIRAILAVDAAFTADGCWLFIVFNRKQLCCCGANRWQRSRVGRCQWFRPTKCSFPTIGRQLRNRGCWPGPCRGRAFEWNGGRVGLQRVGAVNRSCRTCWPTVRASCCE